MSDVSETLRPGDPAVVNRPGDPAGAYRPGTLTVSSDPAAVNAAVRALRAVGRRVALVPTMGALHRGHLELVRQARRSAEIVVVSIFVNPLQFGPSEDLERYPRTLDADVEALSAEGVDMVFAPTAATMYPNGMRTTVQPGPIAGEMEGAVRPGHFAGVLTVVAKLFNIVGPQAAYFGEKDYQQLVVIDQMVRDLNMPLTVHGVPTVRESDGLALSSRNRYLDPQAREAAVALSAALTAGSAAAVHGVGAALDATRAVLASVPSVQPDYVELRSRSLGPAPAEGPARLLVAARVGPARLLDNIEVHIGPQPDPAEPKAADPGSSDLGSGEQA